MDFEFSNNTQFDLDLYTTANARAQVVSTQKPKLFLQRGLHFAVNSDIQMQVTGTNDPYPAIGVNEVYTVAAFVMPSADANSYNRILGSKDANGTIIWELVDELNEFKLRYLIDDTGSYITYTIDFD